MKKIAIIFNGGTISMKIDEKINAAVPSIVCEEIMAMVTGIEEFAEIEAILFQVCHHLYDFRNYVELSDFGSRTFRQG